MEPSTLSLPIRGETATNFGKCKQPL